MAMHRSVPRNAASSMDSTTSPGRSHHLWPSSAPTPSTRRRQRPTPTPSTVAVPAQPAQPGRLRGRRPARPRRELERPGLGHVMARHASIALGHPRDLDRRLAHPGMGHGAGRQVPMALPPQAGHGVGRGPRTPQRPPLAIFSTGFTPSPARPNTAAGDALYSVTAVAPSFVDVSYQRIRRAAASSYPSVLEVFPRD